MSKLKAATSVRSANARSRGWDPFRGMIRMRKVTLIVWVAGNSRFTVWSKMAYLSGFSSVSNSSFTSFGSNDTALTEPLQINSSVFLNNNIAFGSRWGYSCFFCFYLSDNNCKLTIFNLFVFVGLKCCSRLPTGSSGTVSTEKTSWRWQELPSSL